MRCPIAFLLRGILRGKAEYVKGRTNQRFELLPEGERGREARARMSSFPTEGLRKGESIPGRGAGISLKRGRTPSSTSISTRLGKGPLRPFGMLSVQKIRHVSAGQPQDHRSHFLPESPNHSAQKSESGGSSSSPPFEPHQEGAGAVLTVFHGQDIDEDRGPQVDEPRGGVRSRFPFETQGTFGFRRCRRQWHPPCFRRGGSGGPTMWKWPNRMPSLPKRGGISLSGP